MSWLASVVVCLFIILLFGRSFDPFLREHDMIPCLQAPGLMRVGRCDVDRVINQILYCKTLGLLPRQLRQSNLEVVFPEDVSIQTLDLSQSVVPALSLAGFRCFLP